MKRFLFFLVLVGLGLWMVSRWNQSRELVPTLAAIDAETIRLIETVVPSVVSITTSRNVREGPLGSGVIVSKSGYILTNYHVVAQADQILVQLNDGGEPRPARVIGGDELADIAVIQIDAPDLRPLPLGDSDAVKVGQLVFAVGNPFGLQETVTKGIISATGRITDEIGIEYFQTEAVINPGSSGGPLINVRGEVVGINTRIGGTEGNNTWQGVGFAIPSNIVRRSMENILKTRRVTRGYGYLGISINPLPPGKTGVVVFAVMPGSPAQKAGLLPNDILIAFNGAPIQRGRDLVAQVAAAPIGSEVKLTVLRAGREMTITLTLEESPPGYKLGSPPR